MSHEMGLDDEIFARLHNLDVELTEAVRRGGCVYCGGRLDRADFPRKPRGLPESVEVLFERRFALCCSREGCRRRTLPPSVRFLGRRVYAAIAIVVACVAEATQRRWQEARRVARWLGWWRDVFAHSAVVTGLRGRLATPLDVGALPGSLLERMGGADRGDRLVRLLALVAGARPPTARES